MSNLRLGILRLRAGIMKPNPRLNLVEWADTYRYLSPESSSTPGKWSTDLVEAARGPMLAVTEHGVKKITVMGPTQLMKTEFINNVVGYFMSQDPAPIIVMQPIEKLADTWATDRLEPMIRDTPILKGLVRNKRERDSGNTKHHKGFPGGHITVVSAGSAADVASRPVRVVLMDEIDKYRSSGKEGNPEKLIEQRTETFWNALSIAVCSPTLKDASNIAARFEDSDQRYFHGRCPYCEQLEKLEWENVRWVDNDPETAGYQCSQCGELWSEMDRLLAIKPGRAEYVATKPFNGHAGFNVNAIASPWQPLSNLVRKFLDIKGDPEKDKVFTNTSLARVWEPAGEVPDHDRLHERRENYPMEIIPNEDIKFLTMGVDVQGDRLEAQILGWTKNKRSYSIAYKQLAGFTHTDVPWKELTKLIKSTFPVAGTEREMPISFTCIDSGFNTSHVHTYVQSFSPNKVRALKGSDSLQTFYKMGSDITQNFDGTKNKFSHKVWIAGSSYIKTDLYNNIKLPVINDEGVIPDNFCHFPEYDLDFFKGICAESLVLDGGKYFWKKHFTRNEPLDTWIYARVAASMFGLDRFKPADWDALEGILEQISQPKVIQEQVQNKESAQSSSRNKTVNNIWKNSNLKRRY